MWTISGMCTIHSDGQWLSTVTVPARGPHPLLNLGSNKAGVGPDEVVKGEFVEDYMVN